MKREEIAGVYVRSKDKKIWILQIQRQGTKYLAEFYRIRRLREEQYGASRVRCFVTGKARLTAEEAKGLKTV